MSEVHAHTSLWQSWWRYWLRAEEEAWSVYPETDVRATLEWEKRSPFCCQCFAPQPNKSACMTKWACAGMLWNLKLCPWTHYTRRNRKDSFCVGHFKVEHLLIFIFQCGRWIGSCMAVITETGHHRDWPEVDFWILVCGCNQKHRYSTSSLKLYHDLSNWE